MNTRKKALLAVIIGNSIFGFSFLFSKTALEMTLPSVMLAVRFTTAFIVLNMIVFLGSYIKKKNGDQIIKFTLKGKPLKYVLLLSIFQPVIYFFAESYGIAYTSSAFAGTIIAVIPIVGTITYVTYSLIECRGQYESLIVPAIMSLKFWGCILYLAVISSVVAFMILNYGSSYVSVSEASLFANLTTVISIVAGIVIVHESFTVQQMIGALLIIGSVYVASVNKG